MGEPINVEVMRGDSRQITLKAFEGRGNPLSYEPLTQPRHGNLKDFRQADTDQQGFASVNYAHGNDEESKEDEFTFRARALIGGGVSSPIKVKVRIIDAPPKLQITPAVDFSAAAGESDLQQIILVNEGGGMLEGRVAPKKPFHVEGEGRFSLGRGRMTNIVIRFSPQSTDAVTPQKISPSPTDPSATITFRGEASVPFSAFADSLQVQPDNSRTGKITITNLSSYDIGVGITVMPEDTAEVPCVSKIPAAGVANFPITIRSTKAGGAGELGVVVSNTFYREDLKVPVPAVPPKLEVITPKLDFRTGNEALLIVRNNGGTEGRFSLELPENVKPSGGAASFSVKPGTEEKVVLRREFGGQTEPPEGLRVNLGKAGRVPVPVLFATPSPTPAPTPSPSLPNPTPQTMVWELNRDVEFRSDGGRQFLVWATSKPGWTNATLMIVTAEGAHPYRGEKAENGLWEALASCWAGPEHAGENFSGDNGEPKANADSTRNSTTKEGSWGMAAVSENDAGDASACWRIAAEKENEKFRTSVSADFRIDWQTRLLVVTKDKRAFVPEKPATPLPMDFSGAEVPTGLSPTSASVPVPRKIRSATVASERTRATVTLSIEKDPEVTDFRLERGKIAVTSDPKKGATQRSTFEPVPHAGNARILETVPDKQRGKNFVSVVGEIDGLLAGTVTLWRLVPLSGTKELAPTEQFLVPTRPPWLFPWRGFFLYLMFGSLVAVLWIMHNRRKSDFH